MKFEELTECPFCGNDKFYVKEYYSGSFEFNFTFDGEPDDNSGMYDGLSVKTNKRAYCKKCGKYLGSHYENTVGKQAEKVLREREHG